jgi:hypothetical protein
MTRCKERTLRRRFGELEETRCDREAGPDGRCWEHHQQAVSVIDAALDDSVIAILDAIPPPELTPHEMAVSILAATTESPPPKTYTVYFYYGADDVLLYVGATGQAHWRARTHNRTARWWRLVKRAEFKHYPTEAEAFAAERAYIAGLNPTYNIADNPQRRTLR